MGPGEDAALITHFSFLWAVGETLGPDRIFRFALPRARNNVKSPAAHFALMVDFTGKITTVGRYTADLGKFPEFALPPPGAFHGDSGARLTQGVASGPQSLLLDCGHG